MCNAEPTGFYGHCVPGKAYKTRSSAYHSEENGQVEKLHRTMESMLTARTEERSDTWDEQ